MDNSEHRTIQLSAILKFRHLLKNKTVLQITQEERRLKTEQPFDSSLPVVHSSTVKFLEQKFLKW